MPAISFGGTEKNAAFSAVGGIFRNCRHFYLVAHFKLPALLFCGAFKTAGSIIFAGTL
jgi:hypothetical protein